MSSTGTHPGRFWFHRVLTALAHLIVGAVVRIRGVGAPATEGQRLCIEAGARGWELLEYQEIERSAAERFGAGSVIRVVRHAGEGYLRGLRAAVAAERPTHYWLDPRSTSQSTFRGPLQSFGAAVVLAWYRVTPVVWLTDTAFRRWRLQAELASVAVGICLVLVDPRRSDLRFAHRRVQGPFMLPLSAATVRGIGAPGGRVRSARRPTASFVGSLYEPRGASLRAVQLGLRRLGHDLAIHSRAIGEPKIPPQEYWRLLREAEVAFTTAVQIHDRGLDRSAQPHLVFRYPEALAAGAALVAPVVPGSEDLLVPGRHYAPCADDADAVRVIARLLDDVDGRERLARAGYERMLELATAGWFWGELLERLARLDGPRRR